MKKLLVVLLSLFMVFTLAACSSSDNSSGGESQEPAQEEDDSFVVGLAMHNQTADFTVQLYKTFKETVEAAGGEVVMVDANADAATQVNQINDLIVQQVDYIVVCPQDASALGAALKEANAAGIPVINCDSKVADEDLDKVVTVISSANYEGGQELGKWIVDHCEDGDELGYLDYLQIEAIAIRFIGMIDYVNASGKNITFHQKIYTGGDVVNDCEDLVMARPDLDGIIGLNDAFAMTAYSVLDEFGVEDPITGGFDGSPAGKQSIKAGELSCTVVNSPSQLAIAAANAVFDLRDGKTLEKEIPVKMWVIDADNVDEYGLDGWN